MTLKFAFWGFYLLFTNVVIILSLYFLDEFNNSNDFVNEIKSATWMAIFLYIIIQTLFLINEVGSNSLKDAVASRVIKFRT